MTSLADLGVVLFRMPLAGVFLTLAAYELACAISRRVGSPAWANPVLLAIALVAGLLHLTGTAYATYFEGAKLIHLLLGPAVVALAVPIYDNLRLIRRSAVAVVFGIGLGGIAAAVSVVAIAWALGASPPVIVSLAPKGVTTAVAIGVSQQIGGIPELTAVVVIVTGILGAVVTLPLLRAAGISCPRACGLAAGVAGHGIGTARMLQVDETAGAFAGLGMGLCGIATGILMPITFAFLRW